MFVAPSTIGDFCATAFTAEHSQRLGRPANRTRQPFTALIADCEGFLGTFLDENPRLLDGLELVVYEADAPDVCDYHEIRRLLRAHAFECVVAGEQNVWRRARA